jgi:hypothetical protein
VQIFVLAWNNSMLQQQKQQRVSWVGGLTHYVDTPNLKLSWAMPLFKSKSKEQNFKLNTKVPKLAIHQYLWTNPYTVKSHLNRICEHTFKDSKAIPSITMD